MSDNNQRSKCSCYSVSEHEGEEARAYIAEHLEKVRVDADRWTVEYRCPLYEKRWLSDQPWGNARRWTPTSAYVRTRVPRNQDVALRRAPLLADQRDADEHVQAYLTRLLCAKRCSADLTIWRATRLD